MEYQGKTIYKAKYDLVFKAVFLGDLTLLASLLASILEIGIRAEDLAILNTELVPEFESGKLSRLDIRVKTGQRHIDIEIQLNNLYNVEKRSVFYLSKLYVEQMTASMRYQELRPTIAINILDFVYLPYAEYHNRYRMKNLRTHDELTDVIEIHFIELPKLQEPCPACPACPGTDDAGDAGGAGDPAKGKDMKDLWMRFLSADSGDALDTLAKEDPMVEKAVNRLVYVSADEQLRYEIAMREKAEMDYFNAMSNKRDEGKAEERKRNVGKMKVRGMSAQEIADLLDLSLDEVEKHYDAEPVEDELVEDAGLRDAEPDEDENFDDAEPVSGD